MRKDSDGIEYTDEITMKFSELASIFLLMTSLNLERIMKSELFNLTKVILISVVEPKSVTNSNLPITERKPPDTSIHLDDMSDMNAAEFEHFLAEIVDN